MDWEERTQLVWVSPLLPKLDSPQTGPDNNFGSDFLEYLGAYTQSQIEKIKEDISNYDLSLIRDIRLIASVPGRHTGSSKFDWGHFKIRKLLKTSALVPDKTDYFVAQENGLYLFIHIMYYTRLFISYKKPS